jgi:hypothetical protein
MDTFDLKRFLVENKLTRNSTLLNENQIPYDIEEFLNDMINSEVLEDLSDNVEEGDNVNGVWEIEEYGDEDLYGEAADDFKKAYQYIKNNGGKITIPRNPDVTYNTIYDGSIGYSLNVTLNELANILKWTPEKLEQEAAKHNTASEFQKANLSAYQSYRNAVKKGLIQNKFEEQFRWTPEKLEQEAAKHNTAFEFQKANLSAYQAYRKAVRKGLIRDKFEEQFRWTPEKLEQEANKHITAFEFQKANLSAYQAYRKAVRKGLIRDKFERKWTPEKLEQEADKYDIPSEFQKANLSAYQSYRIAVRKGLIRDKFKPTKDVSPTSQSTSLSINYPDNNPYFGNTTTTFDKLNENKMQDFDLKRFLVENKMTRNSRLLNEITNEQIIQFVQNVDPEGRQYIETYFENPGSYTIDGAIDYLTSHSSLFGNNLDPDDQDGGLSGFTQNDLIQYAQDAGWGRGEIDYMLDLSPVKYLERG